MARLLAIAIPVVALVVVALVAGVSFGQVLGAIATIAVIMFLAHVTGLGPLA
jgi:hypothetical protein